MITVITAADSNFKEFVEKCADSSKQLNYKTLNAIISCRLSIP